MVLDAHTRPRRRRQSARPARGAGLPDLRSASGRRPCLWPWRSARVQSSAGSPYAIGTAEAGQHEGREPREVAPFRWCLLRSADLAQLATLALGEATPDAEALVVLERVLEAL